METRRYKYKVVKENNRSCVVNGNSKYSLVYEKDTNVYAPEGTLGVMVFKSRQEAHLWLNAWNRVALITNELWSIKKVIPIGRGKVPKLMTRRPISEVMDRFYSNTSREDEVRSFIPKGTICYPGVFVCD